MNGERNYWLNAGAALAIGLVMSSIIFGWFYSKTKKGDEAITVTGSAVGVGIVATHDGQFVAESIALPAPSSATIFGPDGSAITHFAGTVDAFSWDGSMAVTSPTSVSPVTLVRWRDGTAVWIGPAGLPFRAARSEPGGTRIAIGLIANLPADATVAPTINLYVVSADGRLVWRKNNVNLA